MADIDLTKMKLGKRAPRLDLRVPTIQKLMGTGPLPPVPAVDRRWEKVKEWVLGANDRVGDCTGVGAANSILNMTTATGHPKAATTNECLGFYSQSTGYDPNAPLVDGENPTDQGGVETDVLASWISAGFRLAGGVDKLTGFAAVDPGNIVACKQSMWLFGGLYIGLQLPLAAQAMGEVWDVPAGRALNGDWAPGGWGGHCTPTVGFEKDGTFRLVTWAKPKIITRAFWRAYVDESYVLLSKDWVTAAGTDPDGFSWDQLTVDMHSISEECQTRLKARQKAAETAASEGNAEPGRAECG